MTLGAYNAYRKWDMPKDEDPFKDGYLVTYPGGYESWSPVDVFEDAYLPLDGDGSKIDEAVVDKFMGVIFSQQLDLKTTHVRATTITGFVQHEVSSCVDPANYDHDLGVKIATKRIKDRLWMCLGFALQWAKYGLKGQQPCCDSPSQDKCDQCQEVGAAHTSNQ